MSEEILRITSAGSSKVELIYDTVTTVLVKIILTNPSERPIRIYYNGNGVVFDNVFTTDYTIPFADPVSAVEDEEGYLSLPEDVEYTVEFR